MDIFRNLSQSAQEALYNSINKNVSASGTFVDVTGDTMTGQLNVNAGIRVGSGLGVVSQIRMSGATLSPAAVAPNLSVEQTFSISNLAVTDTIMLNKPSGQTGLSIGNVRVSAASTLAIQFVNVSGATIVPTAAEYYKFVAFR